MRLKILKHSASLDDAIMEGIFLGALVEFESLGGLEPYGIECQDFTVEFLNNPHKPQDLPEGKMAIMGFFHENDCLLLGYVGGKSNPRFKSQHYNLPHKSGGSLAGHIVRDSRYKDAVDAGMTASWIKRNCWRVNIYADAAHGTELMKEACRFLKSRFGPRYS